MLDIIQVRHRHVKSAFWSINTSAVLGILMPDTVVRSMHSKADSDMGKQHVL